jgi:hypothetical protein
MSSEEDKILKNGIKLSGEMLVIPGSSLLLDGNVKSGLFHAGAGILAGGLLGIPGFLLVAANSYSTSCTGKGLLAHLSGSKNPRDIKLGKKIERDIAAGKTFEEIKEEMIEDIEDICEEIGVASQPNKEDQTV